MVTLVSCLLRQSDADRLARVFMHGSENTHLLRKGKYHCTADLLFDRLGIGQTCKSVYSFNSTKQLNPYEVSECSLHG